MGWNENKDEGWGGRQNATGYRMRWEMGWDRKWDLMKDGMGCSVGWGMIWVGEVGSGCGVGLELGSAGGDGMAVEMRVWMIWGGKAGNVGQLGNGVAVGLKIGMGHWITWGNGWDGNWDRRWDGRCTGMGHGIGLDKGGTRDGKGRGMRCEMGWDGIRVG